MCPPTTNQPAMAYLFGSNQGDEPCLVSKRDAASEMESALVNISMEENDKTSAANIVSMASVYEFTDPGTKGAFVGSVLVVQRTTALLCRAVNGLSVRVDCGGFEVTRHRVSAQQFKMYRHLICRRNALIQKEKEMRRNLNDKERALDKMIVIANTDRTGSLVTTQLNRSASLESQGSYLLGIRDMKIKEEKAAESDGEEDEDDEDQDKPAEVTTPKSKMSIEELGKQGRKLIREANRIANLEWEDYAREFGADTSPVGGTGGSSPTEGLISLQKTTQDLRDKYMLASRQRAATAKLVTYLEVTGAADAFDKGARNTNLFSTKESLEVLPFLPSFGDAKLEALGIHQALNDVFHLLLKKCVDPMVVAIKTKENNDCVAAADELKYKGDVMRRWSETAFATKKGEAKPRDWVLVKRILDGHYDGKLTPEKIKDISPPLLVCMQELIAAMMLNRKTLEAIFAEPAADATAVDATDSDARRRLSMNGAGGGGGDGGGASSLLSSLPSSV